MRVVLAGLVLALGVWCACCLVPQDHMTPTYVDRRAQGIARNMESCIRVHGQSSNSAALRCTCEAETKCLAENLPKSCAWDEWPLESHGGYYPVIVGRCEDR